MRLRSKLLISQIFVFLTMFLLLTILVFNVVYITAINTDCKNVMNLNRQIMTGMEQYFEELERFTSVVKNNDEFKQLLKVYFDEPGKEIQAKIRLYLSGLQIKNEVKSYRVLGIHVQGHINNEYYEFDTVGLSEQIKNHIKLKLTNITVYDRKGDFIYPFQYSSDSSTVFGNQFNMAYAYVLPFSYMNFSGTVTVISSYDQINYLIQNIGRYCKDYLLLNSNNKIIETNLELTGIDINKTLENLIYENSYNEGYYIESDAVTMAVFSSYGKWKIMNRLTRTDVMKNNMYLIILDEILVAVFGLGVILLMIPLVNRFTAPLAHVSEQMYEISKGNLEARVKINSKDEIAKVGEAFNLMVEKLQKNINHIIEQEQRAQRMRYSLLISQVDPHFIYNTMNCITYLAQKGKCEEVIAVNKAMIEILKDRLRIDIEDIYDTLEQEIKVVEQYLIIQSYRYADTFKTRISMQDGIEKIYIAKNILQPLVENALLHGILCNKDEEGLIIGGCITIEAALEGGNIVLSVKDNGVGISEEILNELTSDIGTKVRGEHIGIRNIKSRIKYIYGENCAFAIYSKENEGTNVTVRLPVMEKESLVFYKKSM